MKVAVSSAVLFLSLHWRGRFLWIKKPILHNTSMFPCLIEVLQAYTFSFVSRWCVYQVSVEEQNMKTIMQLPHPNLWLSPGKIYWLQQHLFIQEHNHSFVVDWISRPTQVHRLDAITVHRDDIQWGMELCSCYPIYVREADLFPHSPTNSPCPETILGDCQLIPNH